MEHTLSKRKKIWMCGMKSGLFFHTASNRCGKPAKSGLSGGYLAPNYGKGRYAVALNSTLLGGVR